MEVTSKFLAGNGQYVSHVKILSNIERNQKVEIRKKQNRSSALLF
jgi:hypothetical protein